MLNIHWVRGINLRVTNKQKYKPLIKMRYHYNRKVNFLMYSFTKIIKKIEN